MFQDNKIIFVWYAGTYSRISANRIIHAEPRSTESNGDKCDSLMNGMNKNKNLINKESLEKQKVIVEEVEPSVDDVQVDCENSSIEEGTPGKPSDSKQDSLVKLYKDDRIHYKFADDEGWRDAVVLGRGGKATGGNKNYYNVKEIGDNVEMKGVNLDAVHEWEKVDDNADENVNIVLIPGNRHCEADCIKAKFTELQKLIDFHIYMGQNYISSTWALWKEMKCMLDWLLGVSRSWKMSLKTDLQLEE